MMLAMVVYIGDEPVDLAAMDLGAVLTQPSQHLVLSGRIVVDVELDGQRLDMEALATQGQSPNDQSQVRLIMSDPRAVVSCALEDAGDNLYKAKQIQTEVAELLQQDQQAETIQRVTSVVQVWQETYQAVTQSVALLAIDLHTLAVEILPVADLIQALLDRLKVLQDLLMARDIVGLADTLLYEWPQIIDQSEQLISTIVEVVNQPRSDERGQA